MQRVLGLEEHENGPASYGPAPSSASALATTSHARYNKFNETSPSGPGRYSDTINWGIQKIKVRPDGKGFWGQRIRQKMHV